ncbi:hypothetical protein HWV62_39774 [Athelia sp. TMB]|nr:hypothetical protein HWV62_39774 [Athelia sp. TMB]
MSHISLPMASSRHSSRHSSISSTLSDETLVQPCISVCTAKDYDEQRKQAATHSYGIGYHMLVDLDEMPEQRRALQESARKHFHFHTDWLFHTRLLQDAKAEAQRFNQKVARLQEQTDRLYNITRDIAKGLDDNFDSVLGILSQSDSSELHVGPPPASTAPAPESPDEA